MISITVEIQTTLSSGGQSCLIEIKKYRLFGLTVFTNEKFVGRC